MKRNPAARVAVMKKGLRGGRRAKGQARGLGLCIPVKLPEGCQKHPWGRQGEGAQHNLDHEVRQQGACQGTVLVHSPALLYNSSSRDSMRFYRAPPLCQSEPRAPHR